MDIGRALTFFTEDERWVEKLAIGTGIMLLSSLLSVILIGVVGFLIVMGYCVRLMNNVRNEVTPVLPEWDQWGDDLARGFKLLVIGFIWALPLVLVMIPTVMGSAIADSSSSGAGEFFGITLALGGSCLAFIYGIFLALIQPGYTVAFARNEEISAGLQFGQIWGWTRERLGQVVIVAIVYIVGSIIITTVASIVGAILCLIGLVVTLPLGALIVYLFQYHLYGQLAQLPGSTGAATEPVVDEGTL